MGPKKYGPKNLVSGYFSSRKIVGPEKFLGPKNIGFPEMKEFGFQKIWVHDKFLHQKFQHQNNFDPKNFGLDFVRLVS